MKEMPNQAATLRYCCAWYAADGDQNEKSTWKFPHAKTKGGPANLAACRNGLARLSGASIPDGDRAGVKRHLQAHLDDAKTSDDLDQTLTSRLRMARPVAHLRQGRRDWYRIEDSAAAAEVYIYDEIGFFGVTAADFVADLRAITAPSINLHVNSPGGEVFDGVAIFTAIRSHPAHVTVHVDGLAASAASFIAQAGDRRVMARNATMMIHEGAGLCVGNAGDMRQLADLLDRVSDNIADIYAQRAGGDVTSWRAAMRAETWYSAAEAVDAGLADEVADVPQKPTALAEWDLSIFNYAGRGCAPAPVAITQPAAEPEPEPEPGPVAASWFTPEMFRTALKEAVA
jgi:ATP-dependent protease ClpP protease subunit